MMSLYEPPAEVGAEKKTEAGKGAAPKAHSVAERSLRSGRGFAAQA
jgi:hypothetical protein